MQHHIKVLMYHRIVSNGSGSIDHWTCVRSEEFQMQLQLLDRLGFTTITFNDYRLAQQGEVELPLKPIIVTFDDGYVDVFETALPAMRDLGMKGVVFILGNRKVKVNYWDKENGIPQAPLMTTEQIIKLRSCGFEIGSHSMNHANLASIGEEDAWAEIARSKTTLEAILETPIETFSYPYGISTPETRQMVMDSGYSHACGVYTGPPSLGIDPFDIRRITVPRGLTSLGFATRLVTPYDRYEWMRRQATSRLHVAHGNEEKERTVVHGATKGNTLWPGPYLANNAR